MCIRDRLDGVLSVCKFRRMNIDMHFMRVFVRYRICIMWFVRLHINASVCCDLWMKRTAFGGYLRGHSSSENLCNPRSDNSPHYSKCTVCTAILYEIISIMSSMPKHKNSSRIFPQKLSRVLLDTLKPTVTSSVLVQWFRGGGSTVPIKFLAWVSKPPNCIRINPIWPSVTTW